MKHLRETFTDQEMEMLQRGKAKTKHNWHDLLLLKICSLEDLQALPEETKLKMFKEEAR
jgi:hypothetical protein